MKRIVVILAALAAYATGSNAIGTTGKVETESDAVRIARNNCADALNIPDNWHARLDHGIWIVRNEQDSHTYIETRIRENDGYTDGSCEVAFTAQ